MKKTATDRYYSIGDLKLQNICDQLLHTACRDFIPLLKAGVRAETLLALSNLRDSFSEYPSEAEVNPILSEITADFEKSEAALKKGLQTLCKTVSKEFGAGSVHHARLEAKRLANHEDLYRAAKRILVQADLLLKEEVLSSSYQEIISDLKQEVIRYDNLLTIVRTAQQELRLATCDKVEIGNSLYVQLIALTLVCSSTLPDSEYVKLYQGLQPTHSNVETAYSMKVA